jgi:hypothetical protein
MISATTEDSQSVSYRYEISGADVEQSFVVGIYRSADNHCDTDDNLIATQVNVPPTDSSPTLDLDGAPAVAIGIHRLKVAAPLPIDPSHPFVCAVADTSRAVSEADEANNGAFFQKFVFGVVTQGLSISGLFPENLGHIADQLRAVGYTDAIRSDWSKLSREDKSGSTPTAALDLAMFVIERYDLLARVEGLLGPDDVIDLHFIGHSRGAVVASQALELLQATQKLGTNIPTPIDHGYVKLTLLDPHPAHNHKTPYFDLGQWGHRNAKGSAIKLCVLPRFAVDRELCEGIKAIVKSALLDPAFRRTRRDVAALLAWFQSRTDDPEVTLPANVDESEFYFQHSMARQFPVFNQNGEGLLFNLWGEQPPEFVPTNECDLTGQRLGLLNPIGHSEVADWYLENVVPELGSLSRFICA